jgi:hypothetical protein
VNYDQILTIDYFDDFPNGNAWLQKTQAITVIIIRKLMSIGLMNLTAQKGDDIRGTAKRTEPSEATGLISLAGDRFMRRFA